MISDLAVSQSLTIFISMLWFTVLLLPRHIFIIRVVFEYSRYPMAVRSAPSNVCGPRRTFPSWILGLGS